MCKLTLFGAPALECDGHSQHLSRRKSWALLAYLAVTEQTHTRDALVTLLWPEHDQRQGRADLSRILSTLRKSLGAAYFLTDRENVALNEDAALWVDVVHFRHQLDTCRDTAVVGADDDCRQKLVAAAELYQADFLAGFTLPDCPAFDEWQLLQTESLRRDLSWLLERLAHAHEADDDLRQAIVYAHRWVNVDPLHEPAHRRLMALYARDGQRAAALRQYQACKRVLAEELGVEPQPETRQLYERIQTGNADRSPLLGSGKVTPFSWPEPRPERERPFVGRRQELAQLDGYLDQMLKGNGQIVFVTGGAGRGKTSLLQEFAHWAQKSHPDLLVTGGNGVAVTGVGDPFLPFREVLGLLTGHFAVRRAGGQLGREQARRLWAALPLATQAILAHGPQLLDVFVSGNRLLARAAAAAPADADWLMALQSKVARRQDRPGELEQAALFGQFSDVLRFLAQRHPLLIILDDLQWIDGASIGLLFQLGRHLAGNHILIVGAYRPDELPRAHAGEPHSLLQILDEFRRRYGDVFIDLARADQVEGRSFVDALVDTEPNRLDGSFRQALFRQTGGHPLFTVELLRDMQSRGDLIQDEAGQWCEGQALDWATFPARVEAVVARRIGRLDDEMREILAVASVEGERFTAKVVARVLGRKERPLLHALSQQLQSQHRLVREEGEVEIGGEYLSLYRFGHALFQQYLYSQLSPGERRHLHRDVGEALELLFAADLDQVAVQLGHHYTAAAAWHKAVSYLIRAADLAYQRASLAEAVRHYQSALAHWIGSDGPGKAGAQRKLGECLWMLDRHTEAIEALQASYELYHRADNTEGAAVAQQWLGRVYWELGKASKAAGCYQRALTLLEGEPESEALAWALTGLSEYYMHVSNYERSVALGEQALALARRLGAEVLVIRCLCDLGSALSGMGDWTGLAMEQESLERALTLNRPHDAGRAYVYIAEALIYLGRYREARDILEEALAYTRRMQVRYIAVAASRQLAHLDWLTGRWSRALAQLQKVDVRLRQEHAAGLGRLYLAITLGRVHNDLGQPETARKQLVEAETGTLDSLDPRVAFLGELARAEMMSGRPAEAATAAAEILEWTDQAPYLYPNVAMALLFICSAPVAYGRSTMAGHARSACQQLQRLDKQYRTRVTTACRLEGQGWLSLTEAQAAEAVPSFKQAVAGWQRLGRPHDLARALSGLSQALLGAGDDDGARLASEQAMELVDALATQLEDPVLRASFLESALVGLRGSGGASDS